MNNHSSLLRSVLCITTAVLFFAGSLDAAQRCSSLDAREGANDNLQPVEYSTTSSVNIVHCLTVPLLSMALPASRLRTLLTTLVSTRVTYNATDFNFGLELEFTDTPREALIKLCRLFPVCPIPVVDPCGPQVVQRADYGVIRGTLSAYVRAAGGGFSGGASFTRIAEGTWCLTDRFEVDSPIAQTLEMPISIGGSVLAAESFGDPNGTFGIAELSVEGSVFGQPVSRRIRVVSVTTIPEQDSIQRVDIVTLQVPAGRSVHPFTLTGRARVETRAQSAGLFGTIVGAATAAVDAPNSIRIGRLRGVGGTQLHPGTVVTGLDTGTIYEIAAGVPAPFLLVPGCSQNGGVLYPTAAGTQLGGTISLGLASSTIATGVTALFLGASALPPSGCGIDLPGLGELLLSPGPAPVLLASSNVANGRAGIAIPVPNDSRLSGVEVSFQGISVASGSGALTETSTGLRAQLGR